MVSVPGPREISVQEKPHSHITKTFNFDKVFCDVSKQVRHPRGPDFNSKMRVTVGSTVVDMLKLGYIGAQTRVDFTANREEIKTVLRKKRLTLKTVAQA